MAAPKPVKAAPTLEPMTRRPGLAARVLLGAGLLALAGCIPLPLPLPMPRPGQGPMAGPPLPVAPPLRKRILSNAIPLGRIAWLSNSQLVFPGIPTGREGTPPSSHDLYLWSLEGPARLLLPRTHNPCAHAGRIHAWQSPKPAPGRKAQVPRPVVLSAPDFQARPVEPGGGWPMVSDENTCFRVLLPTSLRGLRWLLLSRQDGFLDLGPNDHRPHPQQPVLHLNGALRRRDTGLRLDLPTSLTVSRTAWDGSYLLYDYNLQPEDLSRWQQSNSLTIWRLDPRRRGKPLTVPAGPWVAIGGGTIQFFPSRAGLLITSNNFARGGAPGDAGAYLLPPRGQPLRLERGLVEDPALSPDGCRLAYAHQLHLAANLAQARKRLVVVDLCGRNLQAAP